MQQNAGELVKYIRSSELAEDETQTVSYQISYRALGLKNAYMPYFSDLQTAGGKVWLRDDTVVRKKRATGKVSFEDWMKIRICAMFLTGFVWSTEKQIRICSNGMMLC